MKQRLWYLIVVTAGRVASNAILCGMNQEGAPSPILFENDDQARIFRDQYREQFRLPDRVKGILARKLGDQSHTPLYESVTDLEWAIEAEELIPSLPKNPLALWVDNDGQPTWKEPPMHVSIPTP